MQKKHRFKLLYKYILSLFIIISFAKCHKIQENKLLGKWKRVFFGLEEQKLKLIYQFKENNQLVIYKNDTLVGEFHYQITSRFFKTILIFEEMPGFLNHEVGNYYIEKVNKEVLILQSYPYYRIEFVRVN